MGNHELIKFTQMLIEIGALYDKSISAMLSELYWKTLKCYELFKLKKAFEAHIRNPDSGQYFPKPADLVRLIEGTNENKALEAWIKLEKSIMQVGAYQSVVFDDPLIHLVLEDLGGWIKICSTLIKDLPYRAHEFQKRYMLFLDKPPLRSAKYSCGILEALNAENGDPIPRPSIVGDHANAQKILFGNDNDATLVRREEIFKKI